MGEALLDRSLKVAKRVGKEVLIVGKFEPFRRYSAVRWIREPFEGYAPIYGIFTALKEAKFRKVLFLPADAPLIREEVLKHLSTYPYPVYIEGNFLHCLLLKDSLSLVEELLRKGEFRIRELLKKVKAKEIKMEKIRPFDYKGVSFKNVNTVKDYKELF